MDKVLERLGTTESTTLSVQPRIVRVRDNDGKPKRFAIARTRTR